MMDIEATKLELMRLLLQTQKESVLTKLKKVFEEEPTDWWNDLSEDEVNQIEKGLQQAKNGDVVEHKEVMKLFDRWK